VNVNEQRIIAFLTEKVYGSHVHGRVYGPCTRLFTAFTDPLHGRTLPEHGHVHGRVPCTRSSLPPVCTAVNVPYTRPCTGRVPYTAVYRAHGRLYGLCTRPARPYTDLVHGHARTVHMAVNSRVHGQRPLYTVCTRGTRLRTAVYTFRKHVGEHGTRPCRQALNTAVFTVRTRLCTRAVNTPVYRVHSRARPCSGHGRTMYTACAWPCTHAVKTAVYMVHGHVLPCTQRCSGDGRTIYMARASCTCTWAAPCTRPCLRPFTACTGRVHHDTVHTRHRKS